MSSGKQLAIGITGIVAVAAASVAIGCYVAKLFKTKVDAVVDEARAQGKAQASAQDTPATPVEGSNEKETLQTSSVQVDPSELSHAVYEQYTKLSDFLFGHSKQLDELLLAKQVRRMRIEGGETVSDPQVLTDINQMPQLFVATRHEERLTIYTAWYSPTNTPILIIQDGSANFILSQPAVDRFVANGPVLACPTFGYLETRLATLIEQWGL